MADERETGIGETYAAGSEPATGERGLDEPDDAARRYGIDEEEHRYEFDEQEPQYGIDEQEPQYGIGEPEQEEPDDRREFGEQVQEPQRSLSGRPMRPTRPRKQAGDAAQGPHRKRRKKKHFFLNVFIFILAVAGVFLLAMSGLFAIKDITVESTGRHFTDYKIAEMSGIKKGDNLWRTKMGEAAKRLEKDPYIAVAQISRELPDTVAISIKERTEDYLIAADGRFVVLDWSGIVLNTVDEAPDLPVIEGIDLKGIVTGSAVKPKRGILLADIVQLIRSGAKSGLNFHRVAVSDIDIVAYVTDTLSVKGKLDDVAGGLEKVKIVMSDLKKQKIKRGTIIVGSTGNCTFSPEQQ
ncbi:MAG: FtsQ-type POTRA domain-containing protein [Clostridiales Family XIII bacterium]|jgi:cell division protein FtsQ|nr:FtsQ-type POTRA domain-containing protein [Clostridiales Family XIII bacterium]